LGIDVDSGAFEDLSLTVTNTIAKGNLYDVQLDAQESTSTARLVSTHSDYSTTNPIHGNPAAVTSIARSRDVSTAPVFRAGTFIPTTESATVDAGSNADVTKDETDLSNNPRWLGKATDIGAYELPEAPKVKALKVTARHASKIATTVKVNTEGLGSALELLAVHHGHTMHSHPTSIPPGHGAVKVAISVHGLKHHTSYKIRVVATNPAGSAATPKRKVTTRSGRHRRH
jgi:hypothetical protein